MKTSFVLNIFLQNRALYKIIMLNNIELARQAADDSITRPMHFAYWITEATNTYPEYVILTALPRQ